MTQIKKINAGLIAAAVLTAALNLSLAGCGSDTGQGGGQSTAAINGTEASAYYNQFTYKEETKSSLTTSHFLYSLKPVVVKQVDRDKQLMATVSLFLFSQKVYSLLYVESVGCTKNNNTHGYVVFRKWYSDHWGLDKTSIALAGIGHATGIRVNGIEHVGLNFKKDLNGVGLKDQTSLLYFGESKTTYKQIQNSTETITSVDEAIKLLDQNQVCQ